MAGNQKERNNKDLRKENECMTQPWTIFSFCHSFACFKKRRKSTEPMPKQHSI